MIQFCSFNIDVNNVIKKEKEILLCINFKLLFSSKQRFVDTFIRFLNETVESELF